ncbi:cytochrome b558/566 subunit B [Sulfolobus sp. C3]|nr:cytochrome b558/566 subunit B [Sulfolobus sp. C3]
MNFFEQLKGNLNLFLIILGISSFLQFAFKEAFMYPSILPLNVPNEGILEALGGIFFYVYFFTLIVISVLLIQKYKLMTLISASLIISLFVPLIPNYNTSFLWYSFEIFIVVIGISLMIESILKSSPYSLLLLPTMFMVDIGLLGSILLNVYHHALFTSYITIYLISLLGFLIYVILWGEKRSARNYVSLFTGVLAFIPFIFLLHSIVNNRYLEILMDMILPSTLGIDLYNPYHITLLVLALGLSAMGIIISIIKGNYSAGIGYFIIISTVFLGIDGYLILVYMISPIIGFSLMTYHEKKRIIDIISPTRKR